MSTSAIALNYCGCCYVGILWLAIVLQYGVEAVVATDWSGVPAPDEYTMAYINVSYVHPITMKPDLHPLDFAGEPENGKFGAGKIFPASGVVLHVRSRRHDGKINHYGCEPLIDPIPDGPWIALIKRGNCNFDVKLQNAQARNASAMVVYDHEDRPTLEKMGLGNCLNCTIPGVFTYKKIGEHIANISDGGTRVDMIITVGQTCTRPYGGINRTSVLFVSISFIVLMIISLAWLVFYYVQRFRYLHAKDRLAQRLCNAAKKALAKIPTRNVKMTDREITGDVECCAVCIEFYSSGDVLRTLPCKHEFHKACVDPWLLEHRTCPMCKMDILKYYGYIFTGSQESILHLDLEDGNLNSSESRETDSPNRLIAARTVRYPENSDISAENLYTVNASSPCSIHQDEGLVRKPSTISLTVIPPQGVATSTESPDMGSSISGMPCECQRKSLSVVDKNPMGYEHDDNRSNAEESSSDATGIPASHQPLIHREDSGSLPLQKSRSHGSLSAKGQVSEQEQNSPIADESQLKTKTDPDLINCGCKGDDEPPRKDENGGGPQ